MKRLSGIVLAASFIVSTLCGIAEARNADVTIRASVSRYTITIGDRIRYAIEIRPYERMEVEFPKFVDDRLGDFEIKDSNERVMRSWLGSRYLVKSYDITSYAVGKHTIPKVEVKYRDGSQKEWQLRLTDNIDITIDSVIPDGQVVSDIKDVKGPLYFREINWALLAITSLSISALASALYLYMRRRGKGAQLSAYQQAISELEKIKEAFSKNRDIKEYYASISDCVRHYIERVFGLRAPEMTTEEFLKSMEISSALSAEQKNLLKGFLNACDLVKFAKYAPSDGEIGSLITGAKVFLEETKDVRV